jgi:hypothetical protein
MAKRTRKLTQACSSSAEQQAVELHKLGFVEFDRDTRPQSINIVGLPAWRHGNRHDSSTRKSSTRAAAFTAALIIRAFGVVAVVRS